MWIAYVLLGLLLTFLVVVAINPRVMVYLFLRMKGVPKELIPEALGDQNSGVISFDEDQVTFLRKSTGDSVSMRWDALSEIYVRITDTGPNEDDAFLMLVDKKEMGLSLLIPTEGMDALLDKAQSLHWFSTADLDDALEAIKNRQLGIRKFLLWSAERNGVSIPPGFVDHTPSGRLTCDDQKISFQHDPREPAVVIPWEEFSTLQIILSPTRYQLRMTGAGGTEFNLPSLLTEGVEEFLARSKEIPRLKHLKDEEQKAVQAIRACDLQRLQFTLIQAA